MRWRNGAISVATSWYLGSSVRVMASMWSGRRSIRRPSSTRTGALLMDEPLRPSRARASRSQVRPRGTDLSGHPMGAFNAIVENDGLWSTTSMKVSSLDRLLRCEDRSLHLGRGHQPAAGARRDAGHQRVRQVRPASEAPLGVHAVVSMAPRWLEQAVEFLGMHRDGHGVLVGDHVSVDEVDQAGLHGAHAFGGVRGDHVQQLVGLPLPQQVPDRVVGDEDLERGDHAAADAWNQSLCDDRAEAAGQLDPDLLLAVGREDVDDAVQGLGGVVGVQGREDQVARLGQGQGEADGLEVTHLADQQHVGVLPEGGAQRPLE